MRKTVTFLNGFWEDQRRRGGLYRMAAERGNAAGQHNLGLMYGNGQGVTQDYVQAHMWLNLAAASLSPGEDRDLAASNRDIVEKKMPPDHIAEAQRLASEWKPQ